MIRKAVIYLVENEIPFEINRMIQNGINKNNDDKEKEDNKVLKKKIVNLSAN